MSIPVEWQHDPLGEYKRRIDILTDSVNFLEEIFGDLDPLKATFEEVLGMTAYAYRTSVSRRSFFCVMIGLSDPRHSDPCVRWMRCNSPLARASIPSPVVGGSA